MTTPAMDDATRTELEAAAFRRLVAHLRERTDVQNIDLMILAGLNEGVWPAYPSPDPWLAPRLRADPNAGAAYSGGIIRCLRKILPRSSRGRGTTKWWRGRTQTLPHG